MDPSGWSVYVITDYRLSGMRPHALVAEEAFRGGADVVQLRDKGQTPGELLKTARGLREIAESFKRVFIVNDRIDIALASLAHGVHVGYDDFPYPAARSIYPKPLLLGASAGTALELREACAAGVDYIGVGPVFETWEAKGDAGSPVGLSFIKEARKATDIPLVAIGGINHENAASVIKAGATAVAVISAVVCEDEICGSVKRLRDVVLEAKRSR